MRLGRAGLLVAKTLARAALLLAVVTSPARSARAQELEPRSYSPSPVGANFVVVGYGNSNGSITFDAGSPISDAHANIDAATVGYSRVFDLAGRQASVSAGLPYVWGNVSGNVFEESRMAHRSGAGDLRLKISTLLVGGPALSRKAFAARTPAPIVGVSLVAVAPTGEYMPDKLINIGANRWALKPEIGLSYPMGRWQADAYAGVWLYADNDDFFGGHRLERDPMSVFQGHLSYTVRPGLWVALDSTYYRGGATKTDGVRDPNAQENARVGLTVSVPVRRGQALLLSYSKGAMTRFGGDFTAFTLSWRALWFD